jgi:hypothetical protein
MSNPNPVKQTYGRKPTDSATGVLGLTSKFVPRQRLPNEAPSQMVMPMQQPDYKPAAWNVAR